VFSTLPASEEIPVFSPLSAVAAVVLACTLACTGPRHQESSERTETVPAKAERIFQEFPSVWFEEYYSTLQVTRDGQRALYTTPFNGRVRLIPVTGGPEEVVDLPGLKEIRAASLGPGGRLALLGSSGGRLGWYRSSEGAPAALPLPPDARHHEWSPDGWQVAFSREGVADSVFIIAERSRGYATRGTLLGLAWLPGDSALVLLGLDSTGTSTLSRLDTRTGETRAVAHDLDPPTLDSPLAVAADGRHVYVALASPGAPDREARHRPVAARQLGIYEVDLADGSRRAVVPPVKGADAYAPYVAAGHLYWVQATAEASIVVLPASGGEAKPVARDAMVPSWRPDGRRIGFAIGEWRWADWAFDWDGGAIDVAPDGSAAGPTQAVIVGYHEDFQPVWSPDGRWIAYHSHRTRDPVATYTGDYPDDIWLRRADAPARDSAEKRLTDFGFEAGSPDWSPDGNRLVFTSFDKSGPPGVFFPFIVTIDPAAGRALRHERLALPKGVTNSVWAAWSPVGDTIAVETDLGQGRHALWIVPVVGTGARKIVDFPMATFGGVSWTPDGKTLVYSALADRRMQLFAVPASGGAPRQLTHDSANVFTPRVSPDGRLIAATRMSHLKEIWRMPLGR
jgi:dipeptidyl aminopeptidase/acylaminoacyl peptidase